MWCTETLARKPRGREQEALQDRLAELAMTPLDMAHRCGSSIWSRTTRAARP